MIETSANTVDSIVELIKDDDKIKVAGIDCDGILRGKIVSKEKFLSAITNGIAFCSTIFTWDMHDAVYATETKLVPKDSGFADFLAIPDLSTFRRIPWEDNIPFFLLNFMTNGRPVTACGRSVLASFCKKLDTDGFQAMAGVELEFTNFQTPSEDGYNFDHNSDHRPNLAAFLSRNTPQSLRPLTSGMFGYSLARTTANKDYFYEIYNNSALFECPIEGWHSESGPGVYEAALKVGNISEMADRVSLFKYLVKSVGYKHNITPCFMAKPIQGLPGNSGHIHISLCDRDGKNVFARETKDESAAWRDLADLSNIGRFFLAGVLDALPDLMPLLAPTINSYKRLIENYWAPVELSWGLEDRLSSVRLIVPPVCKPSATRLEVRIGGADLQPHFALSAILAAGWRGVQQKMEIHIPPTWALTEEGRRAERLPNTLEKSLGKFRAIGSVARELFGDDFVDHYVASRDHELSLWREAVTDWEVKRYIETV
ncbi:putative glutamine synthetase [Phaeosphaeriaceae sp. PMI808]|nr:putative glutamine synthetase [Phaeosphaeriaceae sp. PMI808]